MRARSRGVMRNPDAAIGSLLRSVSHSVGPMPNGSNSVSRANIQCFASPFCDDPGQQRGRAAVVKPALSRLHYNWPAKDKTIAVGRNVHGGFTVGWVGIGDA